jgi:hypothetical protein
LVLLAFALPYGALFGGLYAKYPRYFLPLAPVLAIFGSAWLLRARKHSNASSGDTPVRSTSRPRGVVARWRTLTALLVVGAALVRCLALSRMYSPRHPWSQLSDWFAREVDAGAVIAVEEWDHPLPIGANQYELRTLPVYDEESSEKWIDISSALGGADYVIIASRRGYAALGRLPGQYPVSADYYRLLLSGGFGFEAVVCFGREASLGPITLADDPTCGLPFTLPDVCQETGARGATRGGRSPWIRTVFGRIDESLVVYDHPRAIVLRSREPALSADEMLSLLQTAH